MTWADARKDAIFTAATAASDVWFTCVQGELTEVFHPSPDRACMRGLALTLDGRAASHRAGALDRAVYRAHLAWDDQPCVTLEIAADPAAPVIALRIRGGRRGLACRCAPRLAPQQRAWGIDGAALVEAAEHGLAIAGICEMERDGDELVLALPETDEILLTVGFGATAEDARRAASESLARGFPADPGLGWDARIDGLQTPLAVRSVQVLATLSAKHDRGAQVAALSTPWGPVHDLAGTYHVVWTRDLVQGAIAWLAMGAHTVVAEALAYLARTQRDDGRWPQSMHIDGTPFSGNLELDEAAAPLLLADLAVREGVYGANRYDEMMCRAANFIARSGPSTTRDRWEDASGLTPYTLATEIAALVVAADYVGTMEARRWSEVADEWWHAIDRWLYRTGGPLAAACDVPGYYVRARDPGGPLPALDGARPGPHEVSLDILQLVRLGLRDPRDPRIADTCRVADRLLAVELPAGRAWRRYPGDRYGEHADGAPWRGADDADGIGRAWPLFAGERAHYDLARGDIEAALRGCLTLEGFATAAGYIPEQVWDADDIPARGLVRGAATGSAAPLGWAHAEYLTLRRSLSDRAPFPRHRAVYRRYVEGA